MYNLASFILLCLVTINVNAFDYGRSFLAEVKPKISEQCYKDLVKGEKNLREFLVQAVSVWNAKTPGLLNGSHDYTGNYVDCLDPDSSPVVRQYCVLNVGITYEGETQMPCEIRAQMGFKACSSNESRSPGHILKWGLCTVSSCSKSNLLVMAEVLLQKSDIGRAGLSFTVSLTENACQTSAKIPFHTETIVFFWLAGTIAVIVTVCTIWHWRYLHIIVKKPEIHVPVLVRNWSAIEHFSSLMTPISSDIQLFHCLKVMSMLSVVFSHELLLIIAGPVANLNSVLFAGSCLKLFRADLAVDTFFAIGGFILANNYAYLNSKSLIDLIIARYFRIVPVFALVVFYASSVLEYTGSGPFWPMVANVERDTCQKNWWLSLLMAGNYGEWSEYCWLVSWYIPCDFHSFILGLLLCRLFKKNEKLGVAAISSLLVASVVYLGAYIAYTNAVVTLPILDDSLRDVREAPTWIIYIRTHFRVSSYLVGMLGGFLTHALTKKKTIISQGTAKAGFLLSGAILGLVLTSGVFYGAEVPYSVVKAALYGSLVRPAWSLGVVLLTVVVVLSKNPLVSAFTEMKIWAPLSRLSFSIYLLHMAIIISFVGSQMQPLVFGYSGLLYRLVVDLVLVLLVSLVVYVCVERPFHGLYVIMLSTYRLTGKPKLQ